MIAGAKEFLYPHMGKFGENYSKQLRDLLRLLTSRRQQITKYGKDAMLKLADPPPETQEQPAADVRLESVDQKPRRATQQEFAALVAAANEGNPEARTRVRKLLDTHPDNWRSIGNLDSHIRAALIRVLSPSWLASESIERVMAAMKDELAGPDPSALVKAAAEQVVICWAYLRRTELNALESTGNLSERRFRDKAVDQAHRRYLESIKVLGALAGLSAAKAGAIVARSQISPGDSEPTMVAASEGEIDDGRIKHSNEMKGDASEHKQVNGRGIDRISTAERAA